MIVPHVKPYVRRRSDIATYQARMDSHKRRHPKQAPPPSTSWTIPSLCAAYDWPSNAPGGGTIAIIELGGGWRAVDVLLAFQAMGLPEPHITDVSVDGTTNSPGGDADGEVALDIQIAGAAYTVATGQAAVIRMYWSQDIASAVAAAAGDGCDVCSISWGADEAVWGRAALDEMEAVATYATAAGMIILAASGDNDSGDGGSTPANVDAPASCPHIIGCGGTSMLMSAGQQVVWNNTPAETSGEGTGGGYSTMFPAQAWQIDVPPPPIGLGRMVPDVAGVADPTTGYDIVLNGQVEVMGGTSCVAPLWAGLLAAAGTKLGWVTPKFFINQGDFSDVSLGGNGAYKASVGPDPCTGLGSPLGDEIVELLAAKPVA